MTTNFFNETGLERYYQRVLTSPSFRSVAGDYEFFSVMIPASEWILVSLIPRSVIFAETNRILLRLIIQAVIALLATTIVIIVVIKRLTSPIVKMTGALEDISGGKWDMTRTIMIRSKDEIGDLAHYFNQTLGNVGNLVLAIKTKINAVTNTGDEHSINMDKTSKAVDNISYN
jgi:methyl-accepting chemotaxis protein